MFLTYLQEFISKILSLVKRQCALRLSETVGHTNDNGGFFTLDELVPYYLDYSIIQGAVNREGIHNIFSLINKMEALGSGPPGY